MDLNENTLAAGAAVAALLLVELRLFRRKLELLLPALVERSRRRDRRARRDSERPQLARRRDAQAVPEQWADDEDTDIHVLMDLERENQRARRKTGQHRPGERAPRPGTHHDR